MIALTTTINILKDKHRIFQSHETIYLHHEFLVKKGVINYVYKNVEIQNLRWFFQNEGKLIKFVSSPPYATLDKHILKIDCKKLESKETLLHLDTEIVYPINKTLEAKLINSMLSGNVQTSELEVRNKVDWQIKFIKLKITAEDVSDVETIEIIEPKTNLIKGTFLGSDLNNIAWRDSFEEYELKLYHIKLHHKNNPIIKKIYTYINGDILSDVISLDPDEPMECHKKFLGLIELFKGTVLWEEKQLDYTTILTYISEIDKGKCKYLRILCGPIRIDEKFKEHYKILKKDMEKKSVVVECRVVLIDDDLQKLHNRYIFDDEKIWDVPPGNLITRSLSTLKEVSPGEIERNSLEKIWSISVELIKNWEKISEKRDQISRNQGF